jgi:hypothetical protein
MKLSGLPACPANSPLPFRKAGFDNLSVLYRLHGPVLLHSLRPPPEIDQSPSRPSGFFPSVLRLRVPTWLALGTAIGEVPLGRILCLPGSENRTPFSLRAQDDTLRSFRGQQVFVGPDQTRPALCPRPVLRARPTGCGAVLAGRRRVWKGCCWDYVNRRIRSQGRVRKTHA